MNAKEIIFIPDETLSDKTNCGSQLVVMLEGFNTNIEQIANCIQEQSSLSRKEAVITAHSCLYDELYDCNIVGGYDDSFKDWLHEKNKRTYHGLMEELDNVYEFGENGNITENGWYETWKYYQEVKGIKVYG